MSTHSSPAPAQSPPAPSSSATTSSTTPAPASSPSLIPPHDNLCIAQFYDANNYNWLSIRNNCSESVHLAFQSRNYPSAVFGAMDLGVGQTANTGHSQAEINAAGGILLYVCPLNYTPVDQARNAIRANRPVGLFACQPQ